MIKYLGSKRRLVDRIVAIAQAVPNAESVIDLFSGTSRVGHALKRAGYRVLANDCMAYAHALATCYVQSDLEEWLPAAETLLQELAETPPNAGYVTQTFCEDARFFTPVNGARIDAIRDSIEARSLDPELKAICLVSLMEAADRVDSTTGLQMAYLKQWAPRAAQPLTLRIPDLLARSPHGKGKAHMLDALEAARTLSADIAYIDPPYNQHSYLGNYHIWETIVRWDAPEAYGIARKRTDVRSRPSVFNSRPKHAPALAQVINSIDARVLIVSFSNEGWVTRDALTEMLSSRGEVLVVSQDFRRYVGAQIGIHNKQGARVGEVSHVRNTEYVFVAGDSASVASVGRAMHAFAAP